MKNTIKLTLAALALGGLLSGCATTESAAPGTQPDAQVTESTNPVPDFSEEPTPTEEPSEEPEESEEEEDPILKFGQSHTWEDGMQVTIGKLEPFKPSDTAAFDEDDERFVKFHVIIKNGTKKRFDPSSFSTTAATGDRDAEQVFDSANGVSGGPESKILPGRSKNFDIGYGIDRGKDFVLEVAPGYDYEAALYAS